jgi:polysaccharide pyruvyl transferase WcaK-like protein
MSDRVLEAWASRFIDRAKQRSEPRRDWKPGRKLKLLIAGYNGAKNTGEEVRVQEIVRQFRRVLGAENLELAVLTLNPDFSREYYEGARQVHLPFVFPPFLYNEVPAYDGVVATCGAMFMSKFSNVPSIMMIEALGIASAMGKLSIAYGGEAGKMESGLAQMCQRYCGKTSIIIRNEESRAALEELGIASRVGTDTAWTFEPLDAEFGQAALRAAGWDGIQPILAVCPNNPFWWPVRPSLWKALAWILTRTYNESHYNSIYFHNDDTFARSAYERYVTGIARASGALGKQRGLFVIVVGMERLDSGPCQQIAEGLGGAPVFASEHYNAFQLVSVLRCCTYMVSSRYHAVVTSMPGLVASAGVSMDPRIRNLMQERGHSHLVIDASDAELEAKLVEVLNTLVKERESICDGIGKAVVKNLKAMAKMGEYVEEDVRQAYSDFPLRSGKRSWEDYLPAYGEPVRSILERYDGKFSSAN